MKFTLEWLKEFLNTNASLEKILEALNNIGLEVEDCVEKAKDLELFNCVLVEECINHPDSDHLHICNVRYSKEKEPITIICGAPNVKSGLKTILAPVGAILPGNFEIKKSKIRGIESNGMLCSLKELGLGAEHDGIIELDPTCEIGTNIADILGINAVVIDIAITPNRGDCLSVYGIARDLAAKGLGKLKDLENIKIKTKFESGKQLFIEDSNCHKFSFRTIRNVQNCVSPEWLQKKLLAVDINPKNALIDITNYVMFTLGQPLHCYDCNKINGNLKIKYAKENEEFVDLFDKKYKLNGNESLICDEKQILCLGGVIGGKCSGTEMTTNEIILESACFNAINTAKTGRLLNINSDAKYRFERGIDFNMIDVALNYATDLILEICGGESSDLITQYDTEYQKTVNNKTFELAINKIEKVIGLKIPEQKIIEILEKLGYRIEARKEFLVLKVPSWKNNILVKEDIIDDVIRIYGYENLLDTDFIDNKVFEKIGNEFTKTLKDKLYKIRKKLVINSLNELVTYAFVKQEESNLFAKDNSSLTVVNPIISELAYMRQSLIPNLLNTIKKNNNRGIENIGIFEIGRVFHSNEPKDENLLLCGLRYGKNKEKDIFEKERNFDIYDVKKDLFDSLDILGINADKLLITKNVPEYYHPNRAGCLAMGKIVLGYFGELHPNITKYFDVKKVNAFELFIDNIPEKSILNKDNLQTFSTNDLQIVKRDLAFIIDKDLEIGNILRDVYNVNKDLITNVRLFDVYSDEKMHGKKSIAFNFTLQPKDKTLTKEEIDFIMNSIISVIGKKYNGELRDKVL